MSKQYCLYLNMFSSIEQLKGTHPGLVLEQELKKRKLGKGRFALQIQEYPQTLSAITKGKRDMNTALALRIEQALGLEEGYLLVLQVFYDIEKAKRKNQKRPNLDLLRPALFWDTSIEKIDWGKQKDAIIKRVWERGNDQEKLELSRFYGVETVQKILRTN